ncbi:hypothetical protein MMC10_000969 [Thelotrema lepadinum]|nr:hypothetical protein [Thelotrema lepadinum]
MSILYHRLTWISSLVLRFCTFFFLRWIPGHHFVPVIFGSFIVYLFSFLRLKGAPTFSQVDSSTNRQTEADGTSPAEQLIREEKASSVDTNGAASKAPAQPKKDTFEQLRSQEDGDLQVLRSLLTGLPSPSFLWSMTALGINALLVLMVADLVFTGPMLYDGKDLSFNRVGYISDTSAKLLIREPDPAQLPIIIAYRKEPVEDDFTAAAIAQNDWTIADKIYYLSEDTDYTYSLTINRLKPSTRYEYSISNQQSGTFLTAPRPGQFHPSTSKFTFLTSSCIKPRVPYSPLSHPLSVPGLSYLSTLLPKLQPSFMLFLGDFIYIDVPRRFGSTPKTYRSEYRRVYASPSWSPPSRPATKSSPHNSPLQNLPWLHVFDDHEIANDWDAGTSPPYPAALDPFNIYHSPLNPPSPPGHSQNTTYTTFTHGPASFFLLDTRTFRSPSTGLNTTDPAKSMLGAKQLQAVLAWLKSLTQPGVQWKILVSSVPFTRNWRVNSLDTWAGYLSERQTLLEAMWDATSAPNGPGVVVLSGDRHEFAATSFPAPSTSTTSVGNDGRQENRWAPGTKVTEFSCSPLSMFYLPFRTYREDKGSSSGVGAGGEDRVIAYIPDGNSKVGAVEIESEVGNGQSRLRYRLFVEGVERWGFVVTAGDKGEGGREAVWG